MGAYSNQSQSKQVKEINQPPKWNPQSRKAPFIYYGKNQEILKTYSTVVMTKDFQKINIPKLPVFTTEDGIHRIKDFLDKLSNWKNLNELIPKNFENTKKLRRSGIAGILAGSLEMVKEGSVLIKQNNLYDEIFIKKTNEQT